MKKQAISIYNNLLTMSNFSFLLLAATLLSLTASGQDSKVIELEQIEFIPTDELLVDSNFTKK